MEIKERITKFVASGLSHREIGRKLKRSGSWVGKKCLKYGIKSTHLPGPKRKQPLGFRKCVRCDKLTKRNAFYYCSSECCVKHKLEKTNDKIVSTGIADQPRQARRYLKKLYGARCELCGRTKWDGKLIPLVLDHKNGNPLDCRIENQRLICPNCDALLPTYKGRNRGNGRFARMQRYYSGKSY